MPHFDLTTSSISQLLDNKITLADKRGITNVTLELANVVMSVHVYFHLALLPKCPATEVTEIGLHPFMDVDVGSQGS